MILTNKVSLESQEDVDSIDINIFPITYYWAVETAIEPMYHMGNSTLVIPQRPFLNIAANAPTANNDTSSDSSHRREYL